MISGAVDEMLFRLAQLGSKPLAQTSFVSVLHVERLHDECSFRNASAFARSYLECTGARAVLTVMTPAAPMLQLELGAACFPESAYHDRIAALAEYADIGLHGHFLREPSIERRPVHNYWSDAKLVRSQIARETSWLESRGLMQRRVYSGGWWYFDATVLSVLQDLDFEFDFTASTARYNRSPIANRLRSSLAPLMPFLHSGDFRLASIPAVSGICGSTRRSAVPHRLIRAFPLHILQRRRMVVSLYGHDWDMNVEAAMRTVADLQVHGAPLVSLADLDSLAAIARRTEHGDGPTSKDSTPAAR